MEYCISALLNQGVTSVPQWGQGHPYEIKTVGYQRTASSSSSSDSYASAEGIPYYLNCPVTMTTDDTEAIPILPMMSSKEEAQLVQLKQRLQAVIKEDHFPNDLILWRFLRARDNNVDKVSDNIMMMMSYDVINRLRTCYCIPWPGGNNIKLIGC